MYMDHCVWRAYKKMYTYFFCLAFVMLFEMCDYWRQTFIATNVSLGDRKHYLSLFNFRCTIMMERALRSSNRTKPIKKNLA